MSISQDDFLPSIYRSKQEFLASLPPWRRLLANLNWHPTIDKKVARYAIEQRLLRLEKEDAQLKKEDAQLAREDAQLAREEAQLRKEDARHAERLKRMQELNARIAALWPSSPSSSTQAPPTGSDSPT